MGSAQITGRGPAAPRSSADLLARARALAGRALADVAREVGVDLPATLKRRKGSVGQLLELALGADAKSAPAPDFTWLGVELKTIPIGPDGRPRESTFVCSAALDDIARERWETSRVKKKLSCVLLLPVEADPIVPLLERRVGAPLLWSPAPDEEALLRADWEDLADLIAQGLVDAVSARRGQVLQLRPKARDAGARRAARDADGEPFATLPRGFYLRRAFTESVLRRHFALPA